MHSSAPNKDEWIASRSDGITASIERTVVNGEVRRRGRKRPWFVLGSYLRICPKGLRKLRSPGHRY
jgi:hypothetical protein